MESKREIPRHAALVARIELGELDAIEELYAAFGPGLRFLFRRKGGTQNLEFNVNQVLLIVVAAIRRGQLRRPERLVGFIRRVMERSLARLTGESREKPESRTGIDDGLELAALRNSPDQGAIAARETAVMRELLRTMSDRDREVLTRFYVLGHPPDQILKELKLTKRQFGLVKSRARARFAQAAARESLERKPTQAETARRVRPAAAAS